MAKRRSGNHRELSELAKNILRDVRNDFIAKDLGTAALTNGYVGLSMIQLKQGYCEAAEATQVDFDLALKELEEGEFVRTGPMVPFENEPGSGVFVLALFSKREYVYLTEVGYRAAAQIGNQKPRSSVPHVHISGGTFHQSPIGIGQQVTQAQQNAHVESDAELIKLTQLFSASGAPISAESRADIERLVELTHQGDLKQAKPLFQKLFGLASETVKQTAWGILTAIITKAIGM